MRLVHLVLDLADGPIVREEPGYLRHSHPGRILEGKSTKIGMEWSSVNLISIRPCTSAE